ncbi:MAG: DUF2723 domain-containing protein [bacterium]|nr:DUF2723 domain-containing protein [bacterium]
MISLIKAIVIFSIFAFLVYNLNPTITDGDSAEITTAVSILGVAHSPGYPLNTILVNFLSKFCFIGSEVYTINLSNLILIISSIFILSSSKAYFLIFIVLSALFYRISLSSEVFASYMFIVSLILKFSKNSVSYFLLGLASGSNHIVIFLLPFLIFEQGINFRKIIYFIFGATVNLYTAIRAFNNPPLNWDEPNNIERFLWSFFRKRYGTFSLAMGSAAIDLTLIPDYIIYVFLTLIKVFGLGFILYFFTLKDWKFQISFWLSILPVLILSNLKITQATQFILDRFMINPILLFTFKIREFRNLYLITLLFKLYTLPNSRYEFFLHRIGDDILKHIPPKSIVIADRADEIEFIMAYKLYVEKKRNDFLFIDANASVTKSYYGQDYFKIWNKPKINRRIEVEKELLVKGDIYYLTADPYIVPFEKFKYGLMYSTKKKYIRNFYTSFDFTNSYRSKGIYRSMQLHVLNSFIENGFISDALSILSNTKYLSSMDMGYVGSVLLSYDVNEAYIFLQKSDTYESRYNLGVYYLRKGKPEAAIRYFEMALDIKYSKELEELIKSLKNRI